MSTDIKNYNQALSFMINKQSLGVKPGLTRIKEVLENELDNPQDKYKTVHIAGTNGKGTIGATIANALFNSGLKVGYFSSPWIVNYREQIQINGEFISESDFTALVNKLQKLDTDCTEFECLAIIAYMYFEQENVDYAVIECGMGGLGDATNVEKTNLSLITPISLDHTDYLGNTIDSIAAEKSGILRKDGTCILYSDELKQHFENKCNKLVISPKNDNLSIVNAALNELNVNAVSSLVRLPARCERIGNVLLDGGHNVEAAKFLESKLENEIAVIGMMKDKNIEGYLKIIAPKCKRIIAVTVNNPRSISANELAEIAKKYCKNVSVIEKPSDAINEKDVTLVCGSFYLAREIRKILIKKI